MANSTATASAVSGLLLSSDRTQKIVRAYVSVVVGAGNYVTGGLTLDVTPITKNLPVAKPIFSSFSSQKAAASPNTNAYIYQFSKGTTLANGTLQIFGQSASAGIAELTGGGATPSGVTGDTIVGYIDFQLGT